VNRKVFITVGALLIIAVALVWLGNDRNAPAVTAQTDSNMTDLNAADISAYRWEAMAKAYVTQQGSPVQDISILGATDKYALEYNLDIYGTSPGREVQNEVARPTVNSLDGTDKYALEYNLDIYGISPGREVQNEAAVLTVNSLDGTDKYAWEYNLDIYGISPGREVQNEAAVPTVNSLDVTDKYAVEYLLFIYGTSPGREVQNEVAFAAEDVSNSESALDEVDKAQQAQMADDDDEGENEDDDENKPPEGPSLATATASSKLTNQPGRAIVSARGNHFIVDSVPPIDGPNEELNPLDMFLGSLATCGVFIAERVADEENFVLDDIQAVVQGDLDPSGLTGNGNDPRLQAMRVHLELTGADEEQADLIVENFMARCPIYTTLSRATDIEITVGDEEQSDPTEGLNTASLSAQLSNQPGRAIVSARGNHFVIDSVPPVDGPNEERNPLDLILGSLATCGTFIFERSAQEMGIPPIAITTVVEGDLDPRGVASMDAGINPRFQAFRVNLTVDGIDDEQAEEMTEQFKQRCPIYTTLVRSAPIDITVMTD
jgi:uncharacterized OsmC-like protein